VQGYLDHLTTAARTRSRALTAIHRFCAWAVETGDLPHAPTPHLARPTVVALAPQELTPNQRVVHKTLVERADSARLSAMFALGYWAGLRIGAIAALQLAQ